MTLVDPRYYKLGTLIIEVNYGGETIEVPYPDASLVTINPKNSDLRVYDEEKRLLGAFHGEEWVSFGGEPTAQLPVQEEDGLKGLPPTRAERPIPDRVRFAQNVPEWLKQQVLDGIEQARRGETIDRGDFSQYLEDDDDDPVS